MERDQIIYNQKNPEADVIFLLGSNRINPKGLKGDSAYQIAKNNGFQGTQEEWLSSLKGDQGEVGNGIDNIILNSDYTLTINYTDGTSYTTTSIRGATGIKGDKGDKGDKGNAFTYSDFTPEQLASFKGEKGNDGKDGHTPIITTSKLNGITTISIDGTIVATINDGSKGDKGDNGHTPIITTSKSNGVTSISVDGTIVASINDGLNGDKGDNGHTPVITASKSNGITSIFADGTLIATINDGQDGSNGNDGHSPIITATKSGTITTVNVDGTAIATINDGDDYILTAQDKQDIANLVDIDSKADAITVLIGDNISGSAYKINRTYAEIAIALSEGANVVLFDNQAIYPYVGMINLDGTAVIAFGISATYNGTAILDGYLILPNNNAFKVSQFIKIPVNMSDLTDDVGYVKNITASKLNNITTIYSDGTAIATINDGEKGDKGEDGETPLSVFPIDTASGSIASFPDGADDIPVESCVVAIEPAQDLHGQDAPYPAGGGKNLVDVPEMSFGDGNPRTRDAFVNLLPGTYACSAKTSGDAALNLQILDENNSTLKTVIISSNATFTINDVAKRLYFYISTADYNGGKTVTMTDFQIELGSTATAYAPYSNICPISGWTGAQVSHSGADRTNPTTYPITFPSEAGTVYGGTLDVTDGTLTVDRAMVTFDGTENYVGTWFPSVVVDKTFPVGAGDGNNFVNSHLPSMTNACNYASPSKRTFQFSKVNTWWGLSSADELKAVVAQQYADGTPVTVCYPLATPIVYNLTPTEIKSLLGDNNVWADAGNTEVTYRADATKYIEKLITATKSGTVTTIYVKNKPIATINDGAKGQDGSNYTLTTQDKADIAQQVISTLPTAQGVSF